MSAQEFVSRVYIHSDKNETPEVCKQSDFQTTPGQGCVQNRQIHRPGMGEHK